MHSKSAADVEDSSILKERAAISYGSDCEWKRQSSFDNVFEDLGTRHIHWALACACLVINLIPAVVGGPVPYIKDAVMGEYGVSSTQVAWLSSGSVFSSSVGSAVFGRMADSFGRTRTFLLCVALVLPLVLLQMACRGPWGFWLLVALQTLLGLPAAGLSAVVVPYILEFCGSSTRGVMGTMINLGWPIGAIYSVLVVRVVGADSWRLCLLAPVPPCILALCCLRVLPESPRWLSAVGRQEEAQQVLRLIAASGAPGGGGARAAPLGSRAEASPLLPEAAAGAEPPREAGLPPFRELASQAYRSDILTVCGLFACAGWESFAFWVFGPEFLEGASGREPPYWIFVWYSVVSAAATLAAAAAIDPFGRKPLLILGNASLLLVIVVLLCRPSPTMACVAWLLMGAANAFVWVVIPIYSSEIFPTRLRGTAGGLANLCCCLAGGLSPLLVGTLLGRSFALTLGVVSASVVTALFLAALCMRETARARALG